VNLNKLLPLTETTFYIMLALTEPAHGYVVMQKVEELSGRKVKVAAGTLYGALENLSRQKLIKEMPSTDQRRRVYALTDSGADLLKMEVERLRHLLSVSERLIAKGGGINEGL
jgi:DNA-binding PadR family transcriptional regulator